MHEAHKYHVNITQWYRDTACANIDATSCPLTIHSSVISVTQFVLLTRQLNEADGIQELRSA